MRKNKICILSNGLARGGTDTFVVNLAKYLDKDKFDVFVINSCDTVLCTTREPEILEEGIKVYRTGNANTTLSSRLKHFINLYKILRRERPEVFHTNIDLYNGLQLFIAWLARVPVRVCHSHNSNQALEIRDGRTFKVRLYQYVMRWMCWNFSNRRCGCSKEAMDFLFKGRKWQQNNYPSIINNGIDLKKFKLRVDKNQAKKRLGLCADKNILTVGQMVLQKNPEFIVRCISSYLRKHQNINFVWVGIGPYRDVIRKWVDEEGMNDRFIFLGSRSDVDEIMKCCDAFFLPSNFEGLGIVLIEAQCAGLSCVASQNVPLLSNCGKVTFVDINAPLEIWHSAIDQALVNDTIIDEDKLSHFSIEHMIEQMTAVFTI